MRHQGAAVVAEHAAAGMMKSHLAGARALSSLAAGSTQRMRVGSEHRICAPAGGFSTGPGLAFDRQQQRDKLAPGTGYRIVLGCQARPRW